MIYTLVSFKILCVFFSIILSRVWSFRIIQSRVVNINLASKSSLNMALYSPKDGVLAQLTEERDACGVGFIASLNNKHSHSILQQALTACACMEHRGATSADNISGDGAGVMTSLPWKLFAGIVDPQSALNKDGSLATAVGMFFLPQKDDQRAEAITKTEAIFHRNGFTVKGWREVPVDKSVLGQLALDFVPVIRQIVVQTSPSTPQSETLQVFEKRLYDTRRQVQGLFRQMDSKEAYVCSLSGRTIVYKGMLRSADLHRFYLDLVDPNYETNFAVYHRRFSTNTVPKWFLAQPMRLLAHNGEINTLLGNINWVKSRQFATRLALSALSAEEREDRVAKGPLVDVGRSDSANLDSILDSFVHAGYSPEEALMILVPEAFESQPAMVNQPQLTAFYRYYESLQEAWDGPALLVFSDGGSVGATLDRNGLRPARYMITQQEDSADSSHQTVHVMSEVGVTKALSQFSNDSNGNTHSKQQLIQSGRLGPGEMLSVNLLTGELSLNDQVKPAVASKRDYVTMAKQTILPLQPMSFAADVSVFVKSYIDQSASSSTHAVTGTEPVTTENGLDGEKLVTKQTLFGWGSEDVEVQVSAMAIDGNEAIFCMGDDAPLACLSSSPHVLYDYFKQRFAQVTNPPIDPLREGAVMSLAMFLGPRGSPLHMETQQAGVRVKIASPVLNSNELASIIDGGSGGSKGLKTVTLSTLYPVTTGLTAGGLESQLDSLCAAATKAVKEDNAAVIHLSDRLDDFEYNNWQTVSYIPPLLAVGAVHHSLIKAGLRTQTSIVVSTAQAWATHHFACLVGYGASAVVPYAAFDAVLNWHGQRRVQLAIARGDYQELTVEKALCNYRKAVDKGLLKILSKMGISLLSSYHGAQIFEALGLSDAVVLKAFKGTASRIGGLSFDEIAAEVIQFSRRAFGDSPFEDIAAKIESPAREAEGEGEAGGEGEAEAEGEAEGEGDSSNRKKKKKKKKLFNYGFLNYFKSGEYHHNNQPLVKQLHAAIRQPSYDLYRLYENEVRSRPPTTLRDVMQFNQAFTPSIPLEQVESVEDIMRRFVSGGMSLGALSREAHETLAVGMNRIGARSNSGEGGEDPIRFTPIDSIDTLPHLKGLRKGDWATSKIKQVASGRFGVTAGYLTSAEQLEIKMAQGAKPGEGGQLPGAKIDGYIAKLRRSKPGVTLISPPPHHDIYSIEDLAQLIHDLHEVHPAAAVSVKLVAEEGIGTVASGVAKAGADIIQISGHDGGTGASPASSIKHAGGPWELGLVEAHSSLRKNGLRQKVLLRVDGGIKSGWDVVMAAAMGAEEYGFGTSALLAEGCIMARICHTNKCPVGVTTQNEALRKRFPGTPENIVNFFGFVAEEVRQILAELGYRSLDEVIGRPGLLQPRADLQLKKTSGLDAASYLLSALQCAPDYGENLCDVDDDRSWLRHGPVNSNGRTLDVVLLEDPAIVEVIETNSGSVEKQLQITNTDRSAFARISGAIAKKHGDDGFNQGQLTFKLTGGAGQSLGAFLGRNIAVHLTGYANDYVGKGMAGGVITVRPPEADLQHQQAGSNGGGYSVIGNTVLYGATSGKLFARGKAGERFAVRNSGAMAVAEGLGDHGCEYMTGGTVLVLGSIGRNFGAGMTGGLAFLVNSANLKDRINPETVSIVPMTAQHEAAKSYLRSMLEEHVSHTQSATAKRYLSDLDSFMQQVVAIVPASEKSNALVATVQQSESVAAAVNATAAAVGAKV